MRSVLVRLFGAAVAAVIGMGLPASGTEAGATPEVVVLDTYGVWRMHCELAPPILATGEPATFRLRWLNYQTPGVAQGWMMPEFDDRFWSRGPVTLVVKSAALAKLCLRGKFTVTEPQDVKGLKLSVGYHGGLIVYVNGKELKREHISAVQALAEGPGGEARTLADCPLPADLLKKGVNVIGLEIVRTPYPAEGGEKGENVFNLNTCEIERVQLTAASDAGLIPNAARPEGFQVWNADLLASDYDLDYGDQAEGLRPVVIMGARNGMFTGKVVVGSTKPIRGLTVTPGEMKGRNGVIPAANIQIRYGTAWGEQALTDETRLTEVAPYVTFPTLLDGLADQPLAEYDAASFVPMKAGNGLLYVNGDAVFRHMLRSSNPEYIRFRGGKDYVFYDYPTPPGGIKPVGGAVVPLWISVKVPASAEAGTYTGTVKIEAEGEKAVAATVEVQVADWTVPSTQDYRTWIDMIQCPDTLSLEYNVPLWSEEHFEMIGKSFRLMGETGCRTVYIPLIGHTNLGNEESMVRWVKRGDRYDYDFSIMERYLDVAEKNMGKPKLIIFVPWDVYMMPLTDATATTPERSRQKMNAEYILKAGGTIGQGPKVTVVDPATPKTELVNLPRFTDTEASTPLWKPLFDQLRERMRKRGIEDRMMLGIQTDVWASKEEHQFFKDVTGGLPWALQSHEGWLTNWGAMDKPETKLMYDISKIGYQARVWAVTFSDDGADRGAGYRGGIESHRGWAREDLVTLFDRFSRERHPCTRWLQLPEVSITGSQRGLGRIGADYWPVLKNKQGLRVGRTYQRYPESDWRNLFIADAMLAPGPDGPIGTNRLEALREGVQESEAYIAIERALSAKTRKDKLGPDLATRCEEYLKARHMMRWLSLSDLQFYGRRPGEAGCYAQGWRGSPNVSGHNWFLSSGWQERTAQLYDLAGAVSKRLGNQ